MLSRAQFICPDCQSPLRRRTSEIVHPIFQRIYYECCNLVCGAGFIGEMTLAYRLSPPLNPNPEIDLPYSPAKLIGQVKEHQAKELRARIARAQEKKDKKSLISHEQTGASCNE